MLTETTRRHSEHTQQRVLAQRVAAKQGTTAASSNIVPARLEQILIRRRGQLTRQRNGRAFPAEVVRERDGG